MPALYTKDTFGSKDFDRVYSVQIGIRAVGCAISAPITALLFDLTGNFKICLFIWIALCVCVIVLGCFAVLLGRSKWHANAKLIGRPDAA